MVGLLMLVVVGLVGLGVVAGIIVVLVRLTQSPKSPKSQPYVPHSWQPASTPGWYPDHNDPNVLRYFDGQTWTSTTKTR